MSQKLKKKKITSVCAQGTVFGDIMDNLKKFKFKNSFKIKKSWIYDLSKKISNYNFEQDKKRFNLIKIKFKSLNNFKLKNETRKFIFIIFCP